MPERLLSKPHWLGIHVDGDTLRTVHRAMLLASLVGLFVSIYLLITYVTGKPIVCGTNAGCELVRASKWATTSGIPRPAFGILFYLSIILLLAFHAYAPTLRPRFFRVCLLAVTTIGFIESAFLTLVQWFDLRAFCLWCLLSAVAATVIFVLSWFDGREPPAQEVIVRELRYIFQAFAIAVLVGTFVLWALLGNFAAGTPVR